MVELQHPAVRAGGLQRLAQQFVEAVALAVGEAGGVAQPQVA